MVPVLHVKFMWLWCWFCYRVYMASPVARNLDSRYGRFQIFYGSDEAFNAAWDRHLTQRSSATQVAR